MTRSLRALLFVTLATFVGAASARAQSIWIPRHEGSALILEALHTSLHDFDEELASGTLSLTGRFRKDPTTAFVVDVPYVRLAGDTGGSSQTVGNLYLGLEIMPADSPFFAEVGTRLPIVSDSEPASVIGFLTDPARIDAFVPDAVPVHVIANIREVSASGLVTRLRLGPIVDVQDGISSRTDVYAVFAWQIGLEKPSYRIGSAITGSSLLTGTDGLGLGERTFTQFEAHADFGSSTIRPGLDLKLPIGEFASVVPLVWGISVGGTF